jgi:photosystem II stability/assembly factor-like uncharacterized protein
VPTSTEPAAGLVKTIISGIPHAALFGISFNKGRGIAVGAGGAIFRSDDGGANWKPEQNDASNLALLAVDLHGPRAVAVGQAGLIVVEDSPGHWKKVESGIQGRLLAVSANSSGVMVAGGQFATLLKSTDAGETWAPFGPDWASYADPQVPGTAEPQIYSVHVADSGQITVAGEFGMIVRLDSLDSPDSTKWRVLREVEGKSPTIFATSFNSDGPSYAVGQTGEALISTDGGENWIRHRVPTTSNFLGVAYAPGGRVVLTGMRVMTRSDDGGISWIPVEEGDILTDWYQAVQLEPGSGRIMAVGHSGKIIEIVKGN